MGQLGWWERRQDHPSICSEETLRYEKTILILCLLGGFDIRLFNICVITLEGVSREFRGFQDAASMRLSPIEKATAAHRLLLSQEMMYFSSFISERMISMEKSMSFRAGGEGDGNSRNK